MTFTDVIILAIIGIIAVIAFKKVFITKSCGCGECSSCKSCNKKCNNK